MRRRLATAAAVLLVLVSGLAAGCTDDSEDPDAAPSDTAPPLAELPELDPVWSADLGRAVEPLEPGVGADGTRGELTTWSTDAGLVLVGREQLTAVADDGTVAWTFAVPADLGPVCRVSEPNAAGLAAVLFGDGQECRTVGLFDVATHELRWTRDLGEAYVDIGDDVAPADANVYVGTDQVVVPTFCDGVLLFATASGEPLDSDLASDREDGCLVEMQISGSTALVVESRGRGDVLSRRDLETGEVLWSTPVARTRLGPIVGLDPLVVELDTRGASVLQRFDETGAPGPYLGLDASLSPAVQGVADGVLAVTYDLVGPLSPAATYRGYDVETGEQRWRTEQDEAFVLGRTGDDLLLAGDAPADPDADPALVLGRAGFADPLEQEGIGTIRLPGQLSVDYEIGWTDDLFVVLRGSALTAYDLGTDAGAPLPQGAVDEPAYGEGVVTADQAVDLCQEVSPATLAGLGVVRGDLPPPARCGFNDTSDDSAFGIVTVEVFPLEPVEGTTGPERAEETLTEFLASDQESNPEYGTPQPVTGVGEEAQVSTVDEPGGRQARLLARWHNVVFVVTASSDTAGDDAVTGPTVEALRDGVGQVVVELIAELEDRAR